MRDWHLTRERLLALLDGELSLPGRWRAERHLRACWHCRAEADELRDQIRALRQGVSSSAWPSAVDTAKARWRWRAMAAEWERGRAKPRAAVWPRVAVGAASAAALLLLTVVFVPRPERGQPAQPAYTFAQVVEAERMLLEKPVLEERLRVEIEGATSGRQVRTWDRFSTSDVNRFASRWKAESGALKHGIFSPAPGRAARFLPSSGLAPYSQSGKRLRLAELDFTPPGDADQIEQRLLRWVESLSGQPLSLAEEALWLAETGGVRLVSADGIGWKASAKVGEAVVEVALAVRSRGGAPERAEFRWRHGGRMARVHLILAERKGYERIAQVAARLEPDPYLAARPAPTVAGRLGLDPPSEAELLAVEAEALVALHQAGLAEPGDLEVRREGLRIAVTGPALEIGAADRIEDALSGLARRDLVVVRLLSAAEGGQDVESTIFAAAETSEPPAVESFFRQRLGVGPDLTERDLFRRMSAATQVAEELSVKSWALERLLRQFPETRRALLPAAVRAALEEIVEESAVGVRAEARALAARLAQLGVRPAAAPPSVRDAAAAASSGRQLSAGVLEVFASRADPTAAGERLHQLAAGLQDLAQAVLR